MSVLIIIFINSWALFTTMWKYHSLHGLLLCSFHVLVFAELLAQASWKLTLDYLDTKAPAHHFHSLPFFFLTPFMSIHSSLNLGQKLLTGFLNMEANQCSFVSILYKSFHLIFLWEKIKILKDLIFEKTMAVVYLNGEMATTPIIQDWYILRPLSLFLLRHKNCPWLIWLLSVNHSHMFSNLLSFSWMKLVQQITLDNHGKAVSKVCHMVLRMLNLRGFSSL